MHDSNVASSGLDPEWNALPENVRQAMRVTWANGVPPLASAVYARWWQLESWLRSLLYVELRAAHGSAWVDALPKISKVRQQGEDEFRYMATPDAQNRLAYADASALFRTTLEQWNLFEHALLTKNVWTGRIEELLAIRNRIGHCRRPHFDDLSRLEQALRDLNGGAFGATSAFNNQSKAKENWSDAVVDGWVRERHPTASRLIKHAERQYDTIFELRCSRRPWAKRVAPGQVPTISGIPGYVWHAFWYFRGGRDFHLDKFWRDIEIHREIMLLVCANGPSSISVSFAAMEDPTAVADAIGTCFDAALYNIGNGAGSDGYTEWQARYAELDPQVHVLSPWALAEEYMRGVSMFGA